MAAWCFLLHLNSTVYPVPSRASLQNAASLKGVPPFEKNFLDDSCSQTLSLELSGTPFPDTVSAYIQHIVYTDRSKQRAQCNWLTGQNGPCIQVVQWERRTERWEQGCAKVTKWGLCFTVYPPLKDYNTCQHRSELVLCICYLWWQLGLGFTHTHTVFVQDSPLVWGSGLTQRSISGPVKRMHSCTASLAPSIKMSFRMF